MIVLSPTSAHFYFYSDLFEAFNIYCDDRLKTTQTETAEGWLTRLRDDELRRVAVSVDTTATETKTSRQRAQASGLTSLMRIWALWTNTEGLETSNLCCRPSRLSCSTFS